MACREEAAAEAERLFSAWAEAGAFSSPVAKFAAAHNFKSLTPVQAAVIPLLSRRDVAVEACTGSGKTLAFLIPVVEALQSEEDPPLRANEVNVGALCVAPTRELAVQISTVLEDLLSFYSEPIAASLCLVAGRCAKSENAAVELLMEKRKQSKWFIVSGTPGRLAAVCEKLRFQSLRFLVFDEADRLVAAGGSFTVALSTLLGRLPRSRRTCVLSATLAAEVKSLVKSGLRSPVHVKVHDSGEVSTSEDCELSKISEQSIPSNLQSFYVSVLRGGRQAYLLKFLFSQVFNEQRPQKAILFCLTCAHVRYLFQLFTAMTKRHVSPKRFNGVCLEKLCGAMTQAARLSALARFTESASTRGSLLIATDVAARGLDVQGVDWIIQFEAPQDPAMFVHRVGRTARAGASGKSIILLDPSESAYIPFLAARRINVAPLPVKIAKHVASVRLGRLLRYPVVPSNHALFKNREPLSDVAAFDEFPWPEGLTPAKTTAGQSAVPVAEVCVDDLKRCWEVCRALNVIDHNLLDLESQAFVSIARAYREHHLQFIFVFRELGLADLAHSTGALRLPRVKEIIGKWSGFKQSRVDPDTIPWLGKDSESIIAARAKKREEEQQKKQERIKAAVKQQKQKRNQRQRHKHRVEVENEEADDFAEEERAFKRVKRGKLSKSDFEQVFG